jgi:prepilin-type N-terminal cleavage/methylation domain-containing protein
MKDERGFTLVEMLIATAITGLTVSVLVIAIYQIFTVTEFGNDKMVANHELQNAAHWFNLDGQRASTASGGSELALTLPDDSSITYVLVGTELHRTAGESQITLARNISAISFSVEDRIITMTITSSPTGRQNVNEQGIYKIHLRPAE